MDQQFSCSTALISQWLNPFVSSKLICLESKEKILQCTSLLPPSPIPRVIGYEFPLKGEKQCERIHLNLRPSELARFQEFSASQKSQQWQDLFHCLRRGIDQQLFCKERIPSIWLELDLHNELPRPKLTFPIDNNPIEAVKNAFFCLKRKKLSQENEDLLHHFIRKGFLIRCMVTPPSDTLYIRLEAPDFFDLSTSLKQLGHPGIDNSFLKICNQIKSFLCPLTFYVEIENHILPRLELSIFSPRKVLDLWWWKPLLKVLVLENLIDEQAYNELFSWPGKQMEPQTSCQLSALPVPQSKLSVAIVRTVTRINLIYLPKKPLEARAYFGAYPRILPSIGSRERK